ncbi:ATP-dependent RecD-like DNA helicase [Radiobacillus sp. PE A8.2]|uniref:SF1B family DNA helicase RecD2 n=1 Tax=Radiobacillus sp. PE A8.2 TaxID=3380349 RepID=UPI0038903B35
MESAADQQKGFIKGELIHNIFFNESEHFSIAKIKVTETNEKIADKEIVIKGYFSRLEPGESYQFEGAFENHKKFGMQYNVTHFTRDIPTTRDGLIAYLSSDLFYGIGKKTAARIIDKLGETAVSKILNDVDCLLDVQGMTKEKAERLHHDLKEHQGFEHVVVNLSQYGFGLKMAQKIYQAYREKAIDILKTDPYQYVFDIEGFGFQRADEVARQNGIAMNNPSRIRAACIYTLQQCIQEGHVYLSLKDHLQRIDDLIKGEQLDISFDEISREIIELHEQQKLIFMNSRVYLPSLYYAETGFVSSVERILSHPVEDESTEAELLKIVGSIEDEEGLSYGGEQYTAIKQAMASKLMILTGGPGTGKTTVIKGIINAYAQINKLSLDKGDYKDDADYPFVLTAPTGRASKRIYESTGLPAVTIHRLLGWNGQESFEKDENNPLSGKLLVIDEFSMVDIWLANQLFKAVPDDMQILIVGDEDQLPSVGPGQVLADLLASGHVPSVKLTEVYRQKEGSKIIQIAHAIKQNNCSDELLTKDHDFNFINCSEHQVVDVVVQIVKHAHQKGVDIRDFQVLAPMYRTHAGIHRLNEEIQKLINPKSSQRREIRTRDAVFRKGDKVIQLVNQPEDGVFNGDIGEIAAIMEEDENEDKTEQVIVQFDEKEVAYERKDLNNLMHAYCTSIHKSQGSEFPIVILPVVPGYRRMLRKNLLYTAITRCKKSLIVCGDKQAFLRGVKEEDTNKRNTTLSELMQQLNADHKTEQSQQTEEEEELSPYDFM